MKTSAARVHGCQGVDDQTSDCQRITIIHFGSSVRPEKKLNVSFKVITKSQTSLCEHVLLRLLLLYIPTA